MNQGKWEERHTYAYMNKLTSLFRRLITAMSAVQNLCILMSLTLDVKANARESCWVKGIEINVLAALASGD